MQHEVFRPIVCAVGSEFEFDAEEELGVCIEVRKQWVKSKKKVYKEELENHALELSTSIAQSHGVRPRAIYFVKEHAVPKTTSGKVEPIL